MLFLEPIQLLLSERPLAQFQVCVSRSGPGQDYISLKSGAGAVCIRTDVDLMWTVFLNSVQPIRKIIKAEMSPGATS